MCGPGKLLNCAVNVICDYILCVDLLVFFYYSLLSGLRQEVAKSRFHQQRLSNKKQCTICEDMFTSIFKTGAKCPVCGYLVCKKCRYHPPKPPPKFKCTVCHSDRFVDVTCMYVLGSSMYFKVMLRQLKDGSQCRKYLAMRVASRRIKWNRVLFDAM